jgi:predicted phosphodiesterase
MNRIAVLSDIHGNLPALEAVLEDVARTGADVVVNLGDILSSPLWPAQTADRLLPLGWPTLAGNHERQVLTQAPERMSETDRHTAGCLSQRHRDWIAGLPPTLRLADDVLMVHGTPGSDLVYWLETVTPDFGLHGGRGLRAATLEEAAARMGPGVDATLVLCGHTHVPRSLQVGRTLVVNPGSVGLQAYDDDHPHRHWVEGGAPHARWALVERRPAGWQVTHHAVPYDWEAAAVQAERNGRAGWAFALRTGRFSEAAPPI